jgi:hypothetical protein
VRFQLGIRKRLAARRQFGHDGPGVSLCANAALYRPNMDAATTSFNMRYAGNVIQHHVPSSSFGINCAITFSHLDCAGSGLQRHQLGPADIQIAAARFSRYMSCCGNQPDISTTRGRLNIISNLANIDVAATAGSHNHAGNPVKLDRARACLGFHLAGKIIRRNRAAFRLQLHQRCLLWHMDVKINRAIAGTFTVRFQHHRVTGVECAEPHSAQFMARAIFRHRTHMLADRISNIALLCTLYMNCAARGGDPYHLTRGKRS